MEDIITANERLNEWCGTNGINYYEGDTALGFLFKYAVPKVDIEKIVFDGYDECYCHIHIPDKPRKFLDFIGKPPKTREVIGSDINPALSLFWAIHSVLKEKGK